MHGFAHGFAMTLKREKHSEPMQSLLTLCTELHWEHAGRAVHGSQFTTCSLLDTHNDRHDPVSEPES